MSERLLRVPIIRTHYGFTREERVIKEVSMSSLHVRTRLMLLAAALVPAASALAQTVSVSTQGVLVTDVAGLCTTFLGDDGNIYFPRSTGAFTAGDRFHLAGTYNLNQIGTCLDTAGFVLNVTSISNAFAGTGTLTIVNERPRLITDDGRTFLLSGATSERFAPGTRLYVQGTVSVTRVAPTINVSAMGAAFTGFGRIKQAPTGSLQFIAESGETVTLDRPGSIAGSNTNDYFYVEGVRRTARTGTTVTSVTARPAFAAVGKVVAQGTGVGFVPDSLFTFDQSYSVAALADAPIGATVYVRGRRSDDYDFGEAKPQRDIRLSRADFAFSGVGTLDIATKAVSIPATVFAPATVASIQFTGDPQLTPDGSLVYVAGPIASQSPGAVSLYHNEIRVGLDQEGYIRFGFGCTPIIVLNNGGYVFPRTIAGLPLNEHVRVRGGLNPEVPCLDGLGLADNTIEVTPCPDCE